MPLIVKENMRPQYFQHPPLVHTAEEKSLVHDNVPAAQSGRHPTVRRRAPGGDNCSAQITPILGVRLFPFVLKFPQTAEIAEKSGNRPRRHRNRTVGFLAGVKSGQPVTGVYHLGRIVCQHAVEVERHPQTVVVRFVVGRGLHHLPGRQSGLNRPANVIRIAGQKKTDIVGRNIFERRIPGGKGRPADVQPIMLD